MLVFGTSTAWLVTMYRFPGRAVVDRLLVLPLAVPTYIVAYCYVELLDFSGPVQRLLRALFGWHTVKDYWFPDVRSMGGAMIVLSAVLYPYVYLTARASFVQQSVCVLEVARTLGQTSAGAFWRVALPLSRPALAAGLALALMETLNDLGAVQYLGVQTLTASIYTTWLQRSSLGGAAQLALVALLFVLALVLAERAARGRGQYHHTTGRYRSIPFSDLEGWRGYAAAGVCAVPVSGGVCGAVGHPGRAGDGPRFGCAGGGLLERRAQQRRRVCRGRRGNSGARSHARLRAPGGTQCCSCASRCEVRARLRPARNSARARIADSVGRSRQCRRCVAAVLVWRVGRAAAVGQPVRGRAGLCHPVPGGLSLGAGGRLRTLVPQSRCSGPHARRDVRCRRCGACTCRCLFRRSALPRCWCSWMP